MNDPWRPLFGDGWIAAAGRSLPGSWAWNLMRGVEANREVYLATLREAFEEYPRARREKAQLAAQLESHDNASHVAAVNELVWWGVMQQLRWPAEPLRAARSPRPDFLVRDEPEFFVEVTTLNVPSTSGPEHDATRESKAIAAGVAVLSRLDVDKASLAHRLVGKLKSGDKVKQAMYAGSQDAPLLAVVFDYTEWSGLGVDLVPSVAELVHEWDAFAEVRREVAGILLLNRGVEEGWPRVRLPLSGLIRNPHCSLTGPREALFAPFRVF